MISPARQLNAAPVCIPLLPAPPDIQEQLEHEGDERYYLRLTCTPVFRVILRCLCGATLEFKQLNQEDDFVGLENRRPRQLNRYAKLFDEECTACERKIEVDARMSGYYLRESRRRR